MGNGILNCKGFSDFCSGKTNIEINNNIDRKDAEMNLDKAKAEHGIITNTFIQNCKLEFFPADTNIKQKTYNKQHNPIKLSSNPIKMNLQKNLNNDSKDGEGSNNFTHFVNESNKNEKNVAFISPSITIATTMHYNNNNNKMYFNKYNIEMLNYLNKVRNNPKSMIEEIDNIKKNNIKIIDDTEYIVSYDTNEMIKLNIYMDKIKENIDLQEPVDILKLNNKLKININLENIEITDDFINELLISKKREIYHDFPQCFFYPIFIKDTKLNILLLLTNNKILDQIFNKDFTDFYVTAFNEKCNRFFAILCLA